MCDSEFRAVKAGTVLKSGLVADKDIYVPCGKCPPCRLKRVQHWVFRLLEQEKISINSHFVTLTYNTLNVPITEKGFMTLEKQHLTAFWKALRKTQKLKIKYYCCGEYGSKTYRPHYHAIIFDLQDVESIAKCWTKGDIHIGQVTNDSIAYTAKYIDKDKRIPMHANDDRLPEFSNMSKGLGANYITEEMVEYHHRDLLNNVHVQMYDKKCSMPRYYRERIYTERQRKQYAKYVETLREQEEMDERRSFQSNPSHGHTYESFKDSQKAARLTAYDRQIKSRSKI